MADTSFKKATGSDTIQSNLVELSANIVDSHLKHNIINKHLKNNSFSDGAKLALVRPIYKKRSRHQVQNYRPVSILNAFLKIYDRYIHNSLIPFVDNFFQFS